MPRSIKTISSSRYIRQEYLEGVNTDSIVDLTVQSILNALDPHSTYVTADKYSEASDEIYGSFYGLASDSIRTKTLLLLPRCCPMVQQKS